MKYRINFSNYNRTKELRKRLIKRSYWFIVLILFVSIVYGFSKLYDLGREIKKVESETMELRNKLEKSKEERKRIISEQEEIILKNKIKFYNELKQNSLSQTAFLNIIEQKTPESIKLINLDVDISRKTFIILGETLNPEVVVLYLNELQKVDIFRKVTLTRQVMQKAGDKKLIIGNFEIKGEII